MYSRLEDHIPAMCFGTSVLKRGRILEGPSGERLGPVSFNDFACADAQVLGSEFHFAALRSDAGTELPRVAQRVQVPIYQIVWPQSTHIEGTFKVKVYPFTWKAQ